eukprot:2107010-Prymnesium_polylepis.1
MRGYAHAKTQPAHDDHASMRVREWGLTVLGPEGWGWSRWTEEARTGSWSGAGSRNSGGRRHAGSREQLTSRRSLRRACAVANQGCCCNCR